MKRTSSSSFLVKSGEPSVASIAERRCSLAAVAVKFRKKCLTPFIFSSLVSDAAFRSNLKGVAVVTSRGEDRATEAPHRGDRRPLVRAGRGCCRNGGK